MAGSARIQVSVPAGIGTWYPGAVVKNTGKTGSISLSFTNISRKGRTSGVEPGQAVQFRLFESSNPVGAVGAGLALVAAFTVNPGGNVSKSLVVSNGKFIHVEVSGVSAGFKGGQATIDAMFQGIPFLGQLDIEICGGKSGAGFAGHDHIGVADGTVSNWPETASDVS